MRIEWLNRFRRSAASPRRQQREELLANLREAGPRSPDGVSVNAHIAALIRAIDDSIDESQRSGGLLARLTLVLIALTANPVRFDRVARHLALMSGVG